MVVFFNNYNNLDVNKIRYRNKFNVNDVCSSRETLEYLENNHMDDFFGTKMVFLTLASSWSHCTSVIQQN